MEDMHVLFVDDEKLTLNAIDRLLRGETYTCHFAESGEDALEMMAAHPIQIVITDMKMPEMDGLSLLQEIKKIYPDTVRLALSAYTMASQLLPCINTGEIFRYITKPVEPDELRQAVQDAIHFFLLRKDRIALVNELHEKNKLLEQALAQQRKAEQKLKRLAIVDDLTSLYNRRYLNISLKEQFEQCQRYDDDMSCLMLDLDHFKQVNDTFGHDFGDAVLREFAIRLKKATRKSDLRFRYGGEEFLIILPKTSLERAFIFADRIIQACRAMEYHHAGKSRVVTVSIGAVSFKKHQPKSFESMIKLADKRLFMAKEAGRDRVV